jgi:hypothetical protein
VDGIRIRTECNAQTRCEGVDIDFLITVNDFTIWLVKFRGWSRDKYELYFPSG